MICSLLKDDDNLIAFSLLFLEVFINKKNCLFICRKLHKKLSESGLSKEKAKLKSGVPQLHAIWKGEKDLISDRLTIAKETKAGLKSQISLLFAGRF